MASEPQKKRALAALRKIVEDETAPARDKALEVLVETLPSELVYAERFAKDQALASTVTSLQARTESLREWFKTRREAQAFTKGPSGN